MPYACVASQPGSSKVHGGGGGGGARATTDSNVCVTCKLQEYYIPCLHFVANRDL